MCGAKKRLPGSGVTQPSLAGTPSQGFLGSSMLSLDCYGCQATHGIWYVAGPCSAHPKGHGGAGRLKALLVTWGSLDTSCKAVQMLSTQGQRGMRHVQVDGTLLVAGHGLCAECQHG